jgi:hypothetical protein
MKRCSTVRSWSSTRAGVSSFQAPSRPDQIERAGRLVYVAFDLPFLDGATRAPRRWWSESAARPA